MAIGSDCIRETSDQAPKSARGGGGTDDLAGQDTLIEAIAYLRQDSDKAGSAKLPFVPSGLPQNWAPTGLRRPPPLRCIS